VTPESRTNVKDNHDTGEVCPDNSKPDKYGFFITEIDEIIFRLYPVSLSLEALRVRLTLEYEEDEEDGSVTTRRFSDKFDIYLAADRRKFMQRCMEGFLTSTEACVVESYLEKIELILEDYRNQKYRSQRSQISGVNIDFVHPKEMT